MADPGTSAATIFSNSQRKQLTAYLTAIIGDASAHAPGIAGPALIKDEANDMRRKAALFALDNFPALCDPQSGCISEDSLYSLLYRGGLDAASRPMISFLYREVAAIGHASGTKTTTTYVAAGASAMPIQFTRTKYDIDILDLLQLICATARPKLR